MKVMFEKGKALEKLLTETNDKPALHQFLMQLAQHGKVEFARPGATFSTVQHQAIHCNVARKSGSDTIPHSRCMEKVLRTWWQDEEEKEKLKKGSTVNDNPIARG